MINLNPRYSELRGPSTTAVLKLSPKQSMTKVKSTFNHTLRFKSTNCQQRNSGGGPGVVVAQVVAHWTTDREVLSWNSPGNWAFFLPFSFLSN